MHRSPFCHYSVTFLFSLRAALSRDLRISFVLCLRSARQHGPHTGSRHRHHILACAEVHVECYLSNQGLTHVQQLCIFMCVRVRVSQGDCWALICFCRLSSSTLTFFILAQARWLRSWPGGAVKAPSSYRRLIL